VEPGGLVDLFIDIAVKCFANSTAELFKAFFDGLFDPRAALTRPLFVALVVNYGEKSTECSCSHLIPARMISHVILATLKALSPRSEDKQLALVNAITMHF